MRRNSLVLISLVFMFVVGCTKGCGSSHARMSPEQVVEAYLDTAFNLSDVSQKVLLMRYTTGNLRHAIESATDQVIIDAYINRKFKITQYSVVERTDRRPREVEIVFQLSYNEIDKNSQELESATITTENTVSVVNQNGLWLISNVLGKKTTIDFQLAPSDVIKAGSSNTAIEEDLEEKTEVEE